MGKGAIMPDGRTWVPPSETETYTVSCPLTGGQWTLQFWDMHQEDRSSGNHRMAVAVAQGYEVVWRTDHFYPSAFASCDGPDAARGAMSLYLHELCCDDITADELIITELDPGLECPEFEAPSEID